MEINTTSLTHLYKAFNAAFQMGFNRASSSFDRIATVMPSGTLSEEYGWLGEFPDLREWIGDRVVHGLEVHDYTIKNIPFEVTIGVKRAAIEDDRYGVYARRMEGLGERSRNHPDKKVFGLLASGATLPCYDGQNFFDTDHPVGDGVASNYQSGAGNAWYLMDTRHALKPLIFQKRKDYTFQAMTREDNENVFMRGEYLYGVDARVNAGFGFWQLAHRSNGTLDETNFNAAYEAMGALKDDHGEPLGIQPDLLVCGLSNRSAALKVIDAAFVGGGNSNTNYKAVETLITPWLP